MNVASVNAESVNRDPSQPFVGPDECLEYADAVAILHTAARADATHASASKSIATSRQTTRASGRLHNRILPL